MTPADRIDELLRTELRRADDLVVTDRYAAVVARSRQRTRRRRAGALVTALVVAVSALGGVTAAVNLQHDDQTAPAVPSEAQLHGTWTRNVDGDRWTVTFAAGAVLVIDPPAGTDEAIDGASYATVSATLRLDAFTNSSCYELPPGTYRWTLTGNTVLQLQADDEPCVARRQVFDGAWTASP
jgi:hypothetical protein